MKTQQSIFVIFLATTLNFTSIFAFSQEKKDLAVFNFDVQGIELNPQEAGNLARVEIEKMNLFQVTDKYDISDNLKKAGLSPDNCYGKNCLAELGRAAGVEMVLSGSVEKIGETLLISIRFVDTQKAEIEKSYTKEFLFLPSEIQAMIRITLLEMHGKEIDQNELNRLTKKVQYENATINPNVERLNLSGPRLGVTYFNGKIADYLMANKSEGGFGAQYPAMFMFGYQFEAQYINSGRFQALVEFIPTITGLDQEIFIPTVSLLNGLRDNIGGWEFAIGPTVGLVRKAKGYYDETGAWHLESDYSGLNNPYTIEERIDSRGDISLQSGFIVAIGKSFKSGKMNIPLNLFMIPSKTGIRFGLSIGYNSKK